MGKHGKKGDGKKAGKHQDRVPIKKVFTKGEWFTILVLGALVILAVVLYH